MQAMMAMASVLTQTIKWQVFFLHIWGGLLCYKGLIGVIKQLSQLSDQIVILAQLSDQI